MHGVTGTGRRANNASQSWVKPEVDPPNAAVEMLLLEAEAPTSDKYRP